MWFFHFVLTPILPFSSSFFLFSSSNLRTPSFLLILSFSLYFFLIFRLFYSLLPFSILLSRTSLLLVLFLLSPSIFPLSLSLFLYYPSIPVFSSPFLLLHQLLRILLRKLDMSFSPVFSPESISHFYEGGRYL